MFDSHIIQTKGFRNVVQDGQVTGFQVCVRTPYYRSVWLSLLEGASVTVDGEQFGPDKVRWTIAGTTYTTAELAEKSEARWPYEELATLTVDKPGGLEEGIHNVEVSITWRWSYIPIEMQPSTNTSERELVLV